MNYILLGLFAVILMFNGGTPPSKEKDNSADTVNWSSLRKLTWDDFRGPPDTVRNFSAETHYVITYTYRKSNQSKSPELHFKIQCYFEKALSWAKAKECNNQLLSHEQAHFDIAELHTRMFRERISKTLFDQAKYDDQIQVLFSDILEECSKMQEKFDKETRYGILAEEQNNWKLNIEDALGQYFNYRHVYIHNMNPHANNSGL